MTCIFFALVGCGEKKTYSPDQVQILSEGVTPEALRLEFRPIAESSYRCPGVVYTRDGDKLIFTYLRRHIDGDSQVPDLVAERGDDGALTVTFPIREGQKKIELIDSSGKSLGSWELTIESKAEQGSGGKV